MNRERVADWWEGVEHVAERLLQPVVSMLTSVSERTAGRLEEWDPAPGERD